LKKEFLKTSTMMAMMMQDVIVDWLTWLCIGLWLALV